MQRRVHSLNLVQFFIFILFSTNVTSQVSIIWQKVIGGSDIEYCNSVTGKIQATSDGGLILTSGTFSSDGHCIGNHGGSDAIVVKMNSFGDIEWSELFGGSNYDGYYGDIFQSQDGNYILTTVSESTDSPAACSNIEFQDMWILKLDQEGNVIWHRCFGGSGAEWAASSLATNDGGTIIAGFSSSDDGDVLGYNGSNDYWVVKLDSAGNMEWNSCYGGSSGDKAWCIIETEDNGYLVSGNTISSNGDVQSFNHGGWDYGDYWVIKLSSLGAIEWEKCFGGSNGEQPGKIISTSDGGYIFVSTTSSSNGDVTGNHGMTDAWVVKIDAFGGIQWQKSYGSSGGDGASDIIETSEGYIFIGHASRNDGDVSGVHGGWYSDLWLVSIDQSGNLLWQKCLGGNSGEYGCRLLRMPDESLVLLANSGSNNGDVSVNYGESDLWVLNVALEDNLFVQPHPVSNISIYPNPASKSLFIDYDASLDGLSFLLYNLIGEVLITGKVDSNIRRLDISAIPTGVYSLVFENGISMRVVVTN
jgi:hypothetical protein